METKKQLMIGIPIEPCCPNCKTEGLGNLNMIISITTEQPLKYYRRLPSRIGLRLRTSHNSSMVNWDNPRLNSIICRNCGFSGKDVDLFEKSKSIVS